MTSKISQAYVRMDYNGSVIKSTVYAFAISGITVTIELKSGKMFRFNDCIDYTGNFITVAYDTTTALNIEHALKADILALLCHACQFHGYTGSDITYDIINNTARNISKDNNYNIIK